MNKYIKEPKDKHYTPQRSLYIQCWCLDCMMSVYDVTVVYNLNGTMHGRWVNTECQDCGKRVCTRVYNHADMCGIKMYETQ